MLQVCNSGHTFDNAVCKFAVRIVKPFGALSFTSLCRGWYFPLAEILQRLFANPTLAPHMVNQQHRTVGDPESFWGSPAFKGLCEDAGQVMAHPGDDAVCLLMSGGIDGVQLLTFGKRTATVLPLRVEDLPGHLVAKDIAVVTSMIIEGKHEPHELNDALDLPVSDYGKHLRALPSLTDHVVSNSRGS